MGSITRGVRIEVLIEIAFAAQHLVDEGVDVRQVEARDLHRSGPGIDDASPRQSQVCYALLQDAFRRPRSRSLQLRHAALRMPELAWKHVNGLP